MSRPVLTLHSARRTHVGRRGNNEDAPFASCRLLGTMLSRPSRDAAADGLVAAALEAGGRDNISVVVADVIGQVDRGPTWPPVLPVAVTGRP
jgi:hypothetical protein